MLSHVKSPLTQYPWIYFFTSLSGTFSQSFLMKIPSSTSVQNLEARLGFLIATPDLEYDEEDLIKYKGSFYKAKSLSESMLVKDENVKVLGTLDGDDSIYLIDKIG